MASGSYIYVGKSRLRRKYKKQKIENRIKRKERRRQQREEAQRLRQENKTKDSNVVNSSSSNNNKTELDVKDDIDINLDDVLSNDEIFKTATNGSITVTEIEQHICRFCEDFDTTDCDSFGSLETIDSELSPLIGNGCPSNIKTPFKQLWKTGRKDSEVRSVNPYGHFDDINNNNIKNDIKEKDGQDAALDKDIECDCNLSDTPENWEDVVLVEEPKVVSEDYEDFEPPEIWADMPMKRKINICGPCCVIM